MVELQEERDELFCAMFVARAYQEQGLLPPDHAPNNYIAPNFTADSSRLPVFLSSCCCCLITCEWALRRNAELPRAGSCLNPWALPKGPFIKNESLVFAEEGAHPPWMHPERVQSVYDIIKLLKSEGASAASHGCVDLMLRSCCCFSQPDPAKASPNIGSTLSPAARVFAPPRVPDKRDGSSVQAEHAERSSGQKKKKEWPRPTLEQLKMDRDSGRDILL